MEMIKQEEKKYFTTTEVAEIMGISRVAVFKKIKKGEIEAERFGRNYLIPTSLVPELSGKKISSKNKQLIDAAVKKAVKDYKEVYDALAKE